MSCTLSTGHGNEFQVVTLLDLSRLCPGFRLEKDEPKAYTCLGSTVTLLGRDSLVRRHHVGEGQLRSAGLVQEKIL